MWSIACNAKFQVMNSIIGLVPAIAAPTPIPVNPVVLIMAEVSVGVTREKTGGEGTYP